MRGLINFVKQKTVLLGAIILATIVGGATTAVVMAAIPDSNGQINACYKSTKIFYLTDPAGNCKSSESAISWSQSGSGNSNTYTNMLSTQLNATPDTLIDIPGFGQFSITQCAYDPNAGQTHTITYLNNTGQTVDFSNYGEMAPGQTQSFIGGSAGTNNPFTSSNYVLSTAHQIVTINLESRMVITSNTTGSCDNRIQAIVSSD